MYVVLLSVPPADIPIETWRRKSPTISYLEATFGGGFGNRPCYRSAPSSSGTPGVETHGRFPGMDMILVAAPRPKRMGSAEATLEVRWRNTFDAS